MTIYKYQITAMIGDTEDFAMPRGAKLLDVQVQGGFITFWALVDESQPHETRRFITYGTGWRGIEGEYVGTVQTGEFVWHLFELPL